MRLEGERAPELIAGVRRVMPECYPATLAVPVLMTAACLNVVLSHEADDVADLNDQVVAVVADASDRGDSVPRALDLWPDEALAVVKEPQAVCRCFDERWPLFHMSRIASRVSNRQTYCLGGRLGQSVNLLRSRLATISTVRE